MTRGEKKKTIKCGVGVMLLNERTETLAEHVYTAGEIVTSRRIRGLLQKIS